VEPDRARVVQALELGDVAGVGDVALVLAADQHGGEPGAAQDQERGVVEHVELGHRHDQHAPDQPRDRVHPGGPQRVERVPHRRGHGRDERGREHELQLEDRLPGLGAREN
jgi:hypothetical protein